jgi:hypothetical protein
MINNIISGQISTALIGFLGDYVKPKCLDPKAIKTEILNNSITLRNLQLKEQVFEAGEGGVPLKLERGIIGQLKVTWDRNVFFGTEPVTISVDKVFLIFRPQNDAGDMERACHAITKQRQLVAFESAREKERKEQQQAEERRRRSTGGGGADAASATGTSGAGLSASKPTGAAAAAGGSGKDDDSGRAAGAGGDGTSGGDGAGKKPEEQQGFFARLLGKLLANLRVSITNVHVRFEDGVSTPVEPTAASSSASSLAAEGQSQSRSPQQKTFAVGMMLRSGKLHSTNSLWQEQIVENTKCYHKVFRVQEFAVYLDPDVVTSGNRGEPACVHACVRVCTRACGRA